MYKIYNILSFIFIPIIYLNIFLRIIQNKEDKIRYQERFGKTKIKRPNKKIIWIHAASIGEFKSCKTLIETYYNDYCIHYCRSSPVHRWVGNILDLWAWWRRIERSDWRTC